MHKFYNKQTFAINIPIAISSLIAICMGAIIAIQGMLVRHAADYFNIHVGNIVFYDSLPWVLGIICNLLSGKIISKYGSLFLMRLSAFTYISSYLCIFLIVLTNVHSLNLYIFCLIISGIGLGFAYPAMNFIALNNKMNTRNKGAILNQVNAFWSISYFITTYFAGIILSHYEWNTLYLIPICLLLVLIVSSVFIPKEENWIFVTKEGSVSKQVHLTPFIILTFVLFLLTSSQSLIQYWFPTYLEKELLFSDYSAGILVSTYGIGQGVARLIGGFYIFKKVNPVKFLPFGIVTLLVAYIIFLQINNFNILSIFIFIIGLASGGLLPLLLVISININKNISPYRLSFLIFMDSMGPICSLALSSYISIYFSIKLAVSIPILTISLLLIIYFLVIRKWEVITT